MGLFINKDDHPEVFHNPSSLQEHNQHFAKTDYLTEIISGQKEAYESLRHSFYDLKDFHLQQEANHINQWQDIITQFKELHENHQQQKELASHVMNRLIKLDEESNKLQCILENQGQLKQDMMDQIQSLHQSNQEMMKRLQQYEITNQELTVKMNEQMEQQQQISEQFSEHEELQNEVLTRLDNQEAITEKILRQINHIRSILFERTNYLAEKIESGYKITSAYVYKLMTGSDKPLALYMLNQKEEQTQNKNE